MLTIMFGIIVVGIPFVIFFFLYLNNEKERAQERWRVERKIDLIHTGEDGTRQISNLPFADSTDEPPPTAQLIPRRSTSQRRQYY